MSEKIDWSDLEQVEPVPGRRLEGWKIVGHYRRDGVNYPHLVIVEAPNGLCDAVTLTDDGRIWTDSPPVIRNKPKRVTLQECWVIYEPDGARCLSTSKAETAADYAKDGFIIRHIPAETIDV